MYYKHRKGGVIRFLTFAMLGKQKLAIFRDSENQTHAMPEEEWQKADYRPTDQPDVTRTLATVQEILELKPIEGADRIEVATILGWKVVVKKGEFEVGDWCVYFEIDSQLPERDWCEFLRERKFRIKTAKMRGQISQGLALPLSLFDLPNVEPGDDLTDLLGVTKHDPYARFDRVKAVPADTLGPFPDYLVPRTDETRVQSRPKVVEELYGKPYYISLKYDGQSGTYINHPEKGFMVCSRGRWLAESETTWWKVAKKYELDSKIPVGYAVQGEVCGPGIQHNKLGYEDYEFRVFNIYKLGEGYLDFNDMLDKCTEWKIPHVLIIEHGTHFEYSVTDLLELAQGRYESGYHREGIVIRPQHEQHSEALRGRMSFKAINNDFLLADK